MICFGLCLVVCTLLCFLMIKFSFVSGMEKANCKIAQFSISKTFFCPSKCFVVHCFSLYYLLPIIFQSWQFMSAFIIDLIYIEHVHRRHRRLILGIQIDSYRVTLCLLIVRFKQIIPHFVSCSLPLYSSGWLARLLVKSLYLVVGVIITQSLFIISAWSVFISDLMSHLHKKKSTVAWSLSLTHFFRSE